MKNPIHKSIRAVALLLLSFATMASAIEVNLQTDDETGEKYVNMPVSGTDNLTITADDIANGITSFKVYDDGGKNGDFSTDANGTLVLTAPAGDVFMVAGNLDAQYTEMTVYDGGVSAAKLLNLSQPIGNIELVGSGNVMTILLKARSNMTSRWKSGIDLTVTVCSPKSISVSASAENGSLESDKTSAIAGETVTLTGTPASGYLLAGLNMVDDENASVGTFVDVDWWSSTATNTATMKMPNKNVSLTPVFTNVLTAEGGLYINMPRTGTKEVSVPAGVTSFKVYDDGGSNKDYSYVTNGSLVLKAPVGYVFSQVEGMLSTHRYSYLSIYRDEAKTEAILSNATANADGAIVNPKSVGPLSCSDNVLVIDFRSDGYVGYPGFELTVTLVQVPDNREVSVVTAENGSVTADKTTGIAMDEVVTLNVFPDPDYELTSMHIKDCEGREVQYTGGFYSNNILTFEMPYCDVTVTPVFEKGLPFVKMPVSKYGTVAYDTLSIPAGTKSFKLYDNGSKDENYRDLSGLLVLAAPEGFVFEVKGNIATARYDKLTIYDGNTKAAKLMNAQSGVVSDIAIVGSNDTITFSFDVYDDENVDAGLDLTVSLVDVTEQRRINISEAAGGSVESNVAEAVFNTVVTLTLTPSEGFYLKSLTIEDEFGKNVPVNLISSFDNTVSFVMPASAVEVTPEWTDNLTADGGLFMLMPKAGTAEVSIPNDVASFKLYDDGGKDGDFSTDADGTLVLTAPAGDVFMVAGNLDAQYTEMTVYDGGVSAAKLLNLSQPIGNIELVGSGNVMTILLKARSTMTSRWKSGIDLTVTVCSPKNISVSASAENGSVVSDKTSAIAGETVTLTGTPASGYLLAGFNMVDDENASVGTFVDVDWWSSTAKNTATMKMPNKNVSLTPVFTNVLTAEGGLYINMPRTGTKEVSVPAGVTSFKVYDDGGINGDYNYVTKGNLILRAPSGYMFRQVEGVLRTHRYSYLSIYHDEAKTEAILSNATANADGAIVNSKSVGPLSCSDNVLVIDFRSDGYVGYPGFELMISMVEAPDKHSVTIADVDHGSVTASKNTEISVGETVVLTANPDEGYFLSGVNVEGCEGRTVKTSGGWYSGNKAFFAMPYCDVTVTPVFEEGTPFINMPVTGTVSVEVSSNVAPFNVYDDGGANGDYSNKVDARLQLTAPAGYVFQISGTAATEAVYDKLTIYDGVDGSENPLMNARSGSIDLDGANALTSSGNIVTIKFTSDGSTVKSGLDLTINMIDQRTVKIASVDGGTMTADNVIANAGETVTLTATPASGYVLSGVTVVDADGIPVEVVGGKWYSGNQAKFAMPEKPVTVTPVFTDDLEHLSVNMRLTTNIDNAKVVIPEGVTSFKVYDDGGKDGNYTAGAISALSIGAPEGAILQMSGSLVTDGGDYFVVLDGVEAMKFLVDVEKTVAGEPVSFSVSSDTLILFSRNDASGTDVGLDVTVMVVDPSVPHKVTPVVVAGGVVATDKLTALPGEVVTLTAEPGDGYLLAGFEVEDAVGNSYVVRGGDFASNTGTFEMPAVDVTVKPLFTNDKSGLFVTMPASGQKTVVIPEGVTSFKVYDDGGKDGYTGSIGIGELVLTPAEGTAFQISGVAYLNAEWTRGVDSMAIARISDGKAMWVSNSGVRGQVFNVSELFVAGGVRFYMDADDGRRIPLQGIDFTVEVVDATTKHNVNVADVTGGSMDSDKDEAAAGETVTLAATSNNGFILSSVRVDGENGEPVSVDGGTWYSNNAASFDMPTNGVTVTPEFTDDWSAEGGLYIQMPKYGITNVDIPEGVTSFKIYDDGGKDGGYYEYTQNELLLTAPEGYVMRLTGTMVADGYAYLRITDGTIFDDYGLIATGGKISPLDVGTLFTSGNTMFISFKARSSDSYDGLDLKVEVVKASVIAYATVNGKNAAVINGNFLGTETVEITSETSVDTVIFQRKFSTSGYSTIVLPFDVNVKNLQGVNAVIEFNGMTEDSDGKDAVAMMYVWCSSEVQAALKSAAEQTDNPEKYEHCNDASYSTGLLTAYKPYMIQMKSSNLSFNLKNVGATIKPTPTNVEATAEGCDWVFRGSLQKHVWTKEDKDMGKIWGFAAENQGEDFKIGHFYQFGPGAWIRPLRAYLYNPNGTLPTKKSQSAPIPKNVSLGDVASIDRDLPETLDVVIVSRGENGGEHTTVIGHINARTGEFRLNRGTRTFDLKGRSVGKPQAKGIYLRK